MFGQMTWSIGWLASSPNALKPESCLTDLAKVMELLGIGHVSFGNVGDSVEDLDETCMTFLHFICCIICSKIEFNHFHDMVSAISGLTQTNI
jgi:hypothetical protein